MAALGAVAGLAWGFAAVQAVEQNGYVFNDPWQLVNPGSEATSRTPPNFRSTATRGATTSLPLVTGPLSVTASFVPAASQIVGTNFLAPGASQADSGAAAGMFLGNPTPANLPALALLTNASTCGGALGSAGHQNFSGPCTVGTLRLTFSRAVTDPVLDLSGLGGYVLTSDGAYARGGFATTRWTVLSAGVAFAPVSSGATNLTVDGATLRVTNSNAHNRCDARPTDAPGTRRQSPSKDYAGCGSVVLSGTFTEVMLRIDADPTPYSSFPTAQYGTGAAYFQNDGSGYADGINGLNLVEGERIRLPNGTNGSATGDAQRFSLRLAQNAAIGDLVWQDANRNGLQDPGEPGLTGVTATLTDADGTPIAGIPPRTTDANGAYLFEGLPLGDYRVRFSSLPADTAVTTPAVGSDRATDSNVDPASGLSGLITLTTAAPIDRTVDAGIVPLLRDLRITKSGPATARVGQTVSYAITVTNIGQGTAQDVQVSDPTPAGVSFVSNSGACTTPFPCSLGALAPGASRTITTTFAIPLGYSGSSLTNTASVTTSSPESSTANNTSTTVASVDTSADVSVVKTVAPERDVLVGDQVTYTITVANAGPNSATNVVITDTLPAGLAFVSATASQGAYDAASGAWSVGTIAPGASPATLRIVATVDQPGQIGNVATKTGQTEPDPDTSNDSSGAVINAAASADVGVRKTVDNESPNVGETVTFTVAARNAGPSDASGVAITDQLPAGLTLVSAVASTGAYDPATGIWTIGALPAGAEETLTIAATVTATGGAVNTAAKTAQNEVDPNPANDEDSVAINAALSADLQVAKVVSNPAPAVGTDVTFTITVRNNGPSPATGVTVTDPLPAGLAFVSATPSQGRYDAATGVWSVGALGHTQSETLSITATVSGPGATTITNSAPAAGNEPDPESDNNSASASVTSALVADLVISKTDGRSAVVPGEPVTYTIRVLNRGPGPVTDALVSDTFPPALTGVTWTCAATAPSVCDTASGAGNLSATVDLPDGGSAVFTVTGQLDPATPQGTLSNTATVSPPAGTTDPETGNNSATDTSAIVPTADVEITKSEGLSGDLFAPAGAGGGRRGGGLGRAAPSVAPGEQVTYTLVVSNHGPSVATAVSLDDPTPPGLSFVSATAPCEAGVTPCALGDLAPGASVTVYVTFAVPSSYTGPDPITNTAMVTTTAHDPEPDNNTASAQSAIAAGVTDLGVTKSNGTTTVAPGTTTTYTIVVTNAGPTDAIGALVEDSLDETKIDVASAAWSCAATGAASCGATSGTGNLSTTVSIAADASGAANFVTFTVQAPVRADATGTLVNTVSVTAGPGQADPNSSNDTDADTLTPEADLAITKSGPATAAPGTNLVYTLTVTNAGPSNAEDVVVSDPTPAGLTFVSTTGDCTTDFPCALGTLAPGTTRTITVTYAAPATYTSPDPIVNAASVSSGTPDPASSNNEASVSSPVSASANLRITKVAPSAIEPGTTTVYTLLVENTGPSAARNVVVSDPTPDGLTLIDVDGPCASFPCTIASLGVGAPVTFTVRFAVPPDFAGPSPVVNTATVSSDTPDPDASDNSSETSTPVRARRADLSVEKRGPSTLAPGGAVAYTFTIANDGPSDVTDGVLIDVLPEGVTFASATPPFTGGTCTGGQTVTCTGLSLRVGESAQMSITGTVATDLETGAVLTNVVTLTSPSVLDPNPDNNRDESEGRVGAPTEADLEVEKTTYVGDLRAPRFAPSRVAAAATSAIVTAVGQTVSYLIVVTNHGPATATNVVIDDLPPPELTLVSVGGDCTALPCTLASLAPGATATIVVTATANAPGVVFNRASVTANEPDPVPSNNTDEQQTTIAASDTDADLSLTKSGPARVGVGETFLYTIRIENRGPGSADNVVVSDLLPASLTVVSVAATQGTCSSTWPVSCQFGTLPWGATAEISILATATEAGTLFNTATISSPTPDPDSSNNGATVITEVTDPASADLAIAKADSPNPVIAGGPLQYVLTVTNRGPGVATAASVSDPLPAGMTALTATTTAGACTAGQTVTCSLGDLQPGALATITITTIAPAALPSPNPMVNTATVSSAAADPDPSNNTASEPTTVAARADIAIVKTAQSRAAAGRPLTYTLVVTNNGPSVARQVVIDDPAPAGLAFLSASAPCADGIPCTLPTLAPGASETITVTYQVPSSYTAPDPIVNVATANSSSTPDPDPTNNSATATVPLDPPEADLSIVKTGPPNAQRGSRVTYVLSVTNGGPADAAGVTLDDPTPAGLTFVSASSPCEGGFPCTLGVVPAGVTVDVTVTFEVPVSYDGTTAITNRATVSSETSDPDPANNTDTVTAPLVEVADIRVTKTVDRVTPTVGEDVVFTIAVRNAGPSDATGVAVTDAMPSALVIVEATPSQGAFDPATGLWTVGALANGASATLQIRARVAAAGEHTNTATKTAGDQIDPDPSNNRGSATLTPDAVADVRIAKRADVDAAGVGSPVTFTITAANGGPSPATGVRVAEVLPPEMTFVSATASAGAFDAASGTWDVGTLAVNAEATLTVVATIDQPGAVTNRTRKISQQEHDPDPDNDEAGVVVNGLSADLQVVKTVAAPPFVATGETVTYVITVSNNGPGAATGVRVEERLPAGLAFIATTPSHGVYVPQTGIWDIGALDAVGPGATATLELRAVVTANAPLTNRARIATSAQPDPNPANDDSETTITGTAIDLAVRITTPDDPRQVGSEVDFFVDATNVSGATSVEPITIAVPLPEEYEYVPAPQDGWNCSLVGRTIFCRSTATLAPDQKVTARVRVRVMSELDASRSIFAHLTTAPDTNPRNNVAQLYVGLPPEPDPDMGVAQSVTVTEENSVQRLLTYRILVDNHGPLVANHVVLTDVLPANVSLVSAEGPMGPCDMEDGRLSCALGTMLPGHAVYVVVVLRASAPGVVMHTVSVSSDQFDMYPRDNQSVQLQVLAPPLGADSDGDGMTDEWESLMGLSVSTMDGEADPDGDGVSNLEEFRRGTHPRGFYAQYFAEGVSSDFFQTALGLLNLSPSQSAGVVVEYMLEGGDLVSEPLRLGAVERLTRDPSVRLGLGNRAYAVRIESDQPIAADRTVSWGRPTYGAHAEVALPVASSTWYFAEGATGPFELFFLLMNPNATPVQATIDFLRDPDTPPVPHVVTIEPFARKTVRVNEIPALAHATMSATVTADQPIVAERAMYFGPFFQGGTDSAGATMLSPTWFFAEGATGAFFEEFILIANPGELPAEIAATFARPDGQTVTRAYTIEPKSRYTILVDGVDPLLAATPVAVTLTSTNDVPVVAERAMYWPDGRWHEGHVALGATQTGQTWAVPSASVGGPSHAQSFVLISNVSPEAGTVAVTAVFDDGTRETRMAPLGARARETVDVQAWFPAASGKTISVIVESLGAMPVPIVVESARYWSTPDVFWAAGASSLAARVR